MPIVDRSRVAIFLVTIVVALGCLLLTSCRRAQPPRNVVIVSIDTLRADHLGCYGYHRNTSPRIDEFAARGVRFETVITPIIFTLPAHTAMLTSLYPPAFGIWRNGRERLSDSVLTLAEVLKERGYSTGAFVGSFVLDSQFGLDQGFDTYDDDFQGGMPWRLWRNNKNLVHVWRVLDEYADGDSYAVDIQHAMRGSYGAFNFVAWADEDGDGLPDTLLGRSEKFEKPAEEWSRWTFKTDSKRIFVGYEFDTRTETFSQKVEPPPGYIGLSTDVYCCPKRGDVPVRRARGYITNMRITAVRSDGTRRTFGMTAELLPNMRRDWHGNPVLEFERRAEDVNRAATAWLRLHSDEPFFLFVHYFDPHKWYEPPGKYANLYDRNYTENNPEFLEGRWVRRLDREEDLRKPLPSTADAEHMIALYDGEIAYADEQVGSLLDTLAELNLVENTLILITSDHGEYMTEHGWCFGHWCRDLHDPVLKVPLVIAAPDAPKGRVVECPVQLVDIPPTVIDLLRHEPVNDFTGESLRDVMHGQRTLDRTNSYVFHSGVSCLRTPEWKFVLYHPSEQARKKGRYPADHRLYNLRDDPSEDVNLIESRRDLARQLASEILHFKESCSGSSTSAVKTEMDEETRRKLEALGYL